MTNIFPYSIVCGVCSNWNALIAAAETKNKLLLRMKMALFTNLRYFFPLVKWLVHVLALSKARNRLTAWSSLNMHAKRPLNHTCTVAIYLLDATKIRVVYNLLCYIFTHLAAHKNADTYSCNIQPYYLLTHQIIYIYTTGSHTKHN